MKTIKEKLHHLNQLVLDGKMMDAFELYYHNDVTMQENNMPPVIGKDANRERELQFLNSITGFRTAKVLDTAFGNNVSFVTWHYDYTHKDWGERNYRQVSVQHWKDGKIINEQFFYGN
jgi:hypothetical protein